MEGRAVKFDSIPKALRDVPRWVLWKQIERGGSPTKVPFSVGGSLAKADDPTTWAAFGDVRSRFASSTFAGIGFEFGIESSRGDFCGVDLDGCRDPKTGIVADWARRVILELDTYAEVSPSETGVKLFLRGKSSLDSGKKKELADVAAVGTKTPAIEIYDWGRYFAVTGWRLKGPHEPQERGKQLQAIIDRFWPAQQAFVYQADFRGDDAVLERARAYVATMPQAVSGQDGHGQTFRVACVLVKGFGLPDGAAMQLLSEYNQRCQPPWSERELKHKIDSAQKTTGETNYLRNTAVDRWQVVSVPKYEEPQEKPKPRATTLLEAAQGYLASIRGGNTSLVETGLPDLDTALAGGVEYGEMVIFAARPSHGKSAAALQCVHAWTAQGHPALIISEEMSALALGKRAVQFLTDVPQEHWDTSYNSVESDLNDHFAQRAECYVVESCGSVIAAVEQIEHHVEDYGVRHVVVDYAQLLRSAGKSRYEQITNTSIALRNVTSKHKLVTLVLCQLNREIENRKSFTPMMSDIKETGQLEQDADVIVFLVWPHRIDSRNPPSEFQLFVAKNRNRAINLPTVKCEFNPSRQKLTMTKPSYSHRDEPARHPQFDAWNER